MRVKLSLPRPPAAPVPPGSSAVAKVLRSTTRSRRRMASTPFSEARAFSVYPREIRSISVTIPREGMPSSSSIDTSRLGESEAREPANWGQCIKRLEAC